MLGILVDALPFGLFGGGYRTAGILRTDPNAEQEPTPAHLHRKAADRGKTDDAHRHALSMDSIPPTLPCAPDEAAESAEKKATIPVADICNDWKRLLSCVSGGDVQEFTMPNFRPILSDRMPNTSIWKDGSWIHV
jgi:hypothetical protein